MMKELLELMKAKGKQEINPLHKEARMNMLGALKDAMSSDMAGHLKGMKKVTVASPDAAGLEHGLDKAKELLHGAPGDSEEEHLPDHEKLDHEEGHEAIEDAEAALPKHMDDGDEGDLEGDESDVGSPDGAEDSLPHTHEEIDAMIKRLHAHKAKLGKK